MTTTEKRVPGQAWFDEGYQVFSQTFPEIAATIAYQPFYVCPECLRAIPESWLSDGRLTFEHVPPESVGGKKMLLTCGDCNHRAGHEIDSHARREADVFDFFQGELPERKGKLKTDSGKEPIRFSRSDEGVKMVGVPHATNPIQEAAVKSDFMRAVELDGWNDFTFKIEFQSYSPSRASTSWLRSAYLAWFAALGYRFVFRRELDIMRQRFKDTESKEPATFRIIQLKPVAEPKLVWVDQPEPFRSYLMLYERHALFLPRYGDGELYSRLAAHPDCNVNFSGKEYPWPTRPLFLHDRLPQQQSA